MLLYTNVPQWLPSTANVEVKNGAGFLFPGRAILGPLDSKVPSVIRCSQAICMA